MIAKIVAWWSKFKWITWVVLAAVVAGAVLVLRRLFSGPSAEDRARFQTPPVPPAVKERVERAEEQALVARVQASTQAEAKKEELVQIQAIPDGKARRERLAAMLSQLPP